MGKLRAQAGFSLIELMIVISIAAVVMAVLTPGIRQATDTFQLRKAASITMAELRTAQALSTANGAPVMFEFFHTTSTPGSPGEIRYWITSGATWTEVRRVRGGEWPSMIQFRDPVGLTPCLAPADTSNKCVIFRPLGYVDNAGQISLRIREIGRQWIIFIEAATGRARIQQ